jgi:hypothetical protein
MMDEPAVAWWLLCEHCGEFYSLTEHGVCPCCPDIDSDSSNADDAPLLEAAAEPEDWRQAHLFGA